MKLKNKALLYNFIGFLIFFLIIRFSLHAFTSINYIVIALVAGFGAIFLAPKFAVVYHGKKEKLMMKWIFMKGVKEIE
ncbi:hypothetical protein SAMN04487906_0513 [Zhouia amylolytica]|uniref:Uncharacterized protein n=2 Tax=Zhouia amylolytica TaxID=376730 RepID=W2UQ43_9FLAO|nr:hypothetical protein [Zhouia amylolytica]ETN96123.1 hypothetical protein P278_18450 [Zhouia amylolytica AD3]MCQ0112969.1 hypothetical protein [Zhouia amylolytica]SFS48945.1 hypothetical protein SAMN04487906_0513 [Zhouia amylolytica]